MYTSHKYTYMQLITILNIIILNNSRQLKNQNPYSHALLTTIISNYSKQCMSYF